MTPSRNAVVRWLLPLFAVLSATTTLVLVALQRGNPPVYGLLEGAFALVLSGVLFAVGYRYYTTPAISRSQSRTVIGWTLTGFGVLAVMNIWFRFLEFSIGGVRPQFAVVTSLTAGTLGGALIGIFVTRAQHRHAEREQALADYHEIFEQAEDGIFIDDPETGEILEVNGRAAELLGHTPEELEGMSIGAISADAPEFSQETARGKMQQALAGEPQQFDWLVQRKDGSTRWVEVSLKRTSIGNENRLLAIVRDISDRKAHERELATHSEAMEASIDGIAILDEDGTYQFVNQAHADIYGYESPEALLGESWRICYEDDELNRFEEDVIPTLFEEGAWRGEATGIREDGTSFPQELSLSTTSDGGLVCVVRDITERKNHEHQITALHDATRTMMQASDEQAVCEKAVETADEIMEFPITAIWLCNEHGDRLEPAAATETSDRLFDELPEYTEGGSLSWQAFSTGESIVVDDLHDEANVYDPTTQLRSELIIPLGDYGVLNTGSRDVRAFTDNDIALVKLLAANTRVALERVDRERDLKRQTDQMEFFNSILRHDVLNGITVIRGRAEFLTNDLEGEQLRDAETIVDWSDDIDRIVQRVRTVLETLTGSGDPQLESLEIGAELDVELDRIRSTYPEVTIDASIPDHAVVLANELLGEVLGNVITNAIEHNEADGLRVSITVEQHDETVTVRVADNGKGVPEDRRDAVFRRGETGHAKSTGSGFGLFFVDSMMDQYGGDVRVERNEDGGATFVLTFQTVTPRHLA